MYSMGFIQKFLELRIYTGQTKTVKLFVKTEAKSMYKFIRMYKFVGSGRWFTSDQIGKRGLFTPGHQGREQRMRMLLLISIESLV